MVKKDAASDIIEIVYACQADGDIFSDNLSCIRFLNFRY